MRGRAALEAAATVCERWSGLRGQSERECCAHQPVSKLPFAGYCRLLRVWVSAAALGSVNFCRRSASLAVQSSNNYLVDPASSHMLVSKIKPCMCQYRPL